MRIFFILSSLFFSVITVAQIQGKVVDSKGIPIPFVGVYLENSSAGTTSNNNGDYRLDVSTPGKHTIVFQFLGYKTAKKKVDITAFPYELNITLEEEQISLEEVEITSEENPANQIIRSTIANKEKNTDKLGRYTADFYSRGLFKIKKAPKKFLGEEVGDFGGGLDSTRSGIIYLSETVSKISYQKKPKRFKEHIIASKVSGSDNGISFNQADEVNFNFYENAFDLGGTSIISPIANGAFGYYRYKLAGTFYTKDGALINKIQILPKRANDRVLGGYIYIVDDNWSIYGTDVTITGAQAGIPIIKELKIKQNYKYIKENDAWTLVIQTLDFSAGFLGFNFDGRFSAGYTNYNYNPTFKKETFTNEVLSFSENATKKDSLYWKEIRPMALTKEEIKDYQFKDSIRVIRKSKKYLDSIDRKENAFHFLNLLSGYSYSNSFEKWSVDISSPLRNINFNTVQGWNYGLQLDFNKRLNDKGKRMGTSLYLNYGASDKVFRPRASFSYKWNNISYPLLRISGGITTSQFNEANPISPLWNTISSVFFERNYMKIYEKGFAKASFSQEAFNGIRLFSSLEFARRKALLNRSNYTMFPQENISYTSNNPQNPNDFTPSFSTHNMWSLRLGASIRFGQKYMSYPDRKINKRTNKYPSLFLGYRKNFGSGRTEWNSDLFYAQLYQNVDFKNWGNLTYRTKAGFFLNKKDIPFMDFAHFNDNRLLVAPKNNYVDGFLALPYYALSTNDKYAEFHAEQNFKGAILSKIPLLNKLNFHLVAGAKGLFTSGNKPYSEFSLGLDNIGFGKWRLLRVDFVQSNLNGQKENRFLLGIKL